MSSSTHSSRDLIKVKVGTSKLCVVGVRAGGRLLSMSYIKEEDQERRKKGKAVKREEVSSAVFSLRQLLVEVAIADVGSIHLNCLAPVSTKLVGVKWSKGARTRTLWQRSV